MRRKIIILEPTKFDLAPLERWGEIFYIFDDHRVSIWDSKFTDAALARLEELGFDQRRDILACIGPQIAVTKIVAALARQSKLKTLTWHARESDYRIVTV